MSFNESNVTRGFKGIWIPKEIWLNEELTMQEKIFLVEIDSLDNEEGCTASNQYFADFFDISKNRVSLVIQNLIEKGYVKSRIVYKDSTKQILYRVLNICRPPYPTFVGEGITQKCEDNNIYNNIYNKKEINKEKGSLPEPYEDLVSHFEEIWNEYPNKKGKAKAFKHYFTWIKGKEYCDKKVTLTARQMWYAVQNYLEEIQVKGTQPQYIKHGDTFFNNIIDYVKEGDEV